MKMRTIIKNTCFTFWLLAFIPFSISAQKKVYHSDLDTLWSKAVSIKEISNDGNWVLTSELSEFKPMQYKLVHTIKSDKFDLRNSSSLGFSYDSKWMVFIDEDSELKIVNLHNQEFNSLRKASKFEFNGSGKMLGFLKKENDSLNSLVVRNLKNNKSFEVSEIKDFIWNPNKDILTAVKKNGNLIQLVSITAFGEITVLSECQNCTFPSIKWNDTGTALLALKKDNDSSELHYFDLKGSKNILSDIMLEKQFGEFRIHDFGLKISADGKKVFFKRLNNNEVFLAEETVEVWNTDDIWVYPKLKRHEDNTMTLLTLWEPETGVLMAIEDEKHSTAKAHPDIDIVLIYDVRQYEPTYEQHSYADIYALDINSGSKKLLVEKQYTDLNFMSISPSGKYVSFFRENNWWIYDLGKDIMINLTEQIPAIWFNKYDSRIKNPSVVSSPYWSADEKYIILHDEYDVWQISVDGKERKRLTEGIESKTSYKAIFNAKEKQTDRIVNSIGLSFDLSDKIIFKTSGHDLKTGITLWSVKNGVEDILYRPEHTANIHQVSKNAIIYSTELYNKPPLFSRLDLKTTENRVFFQTNPEFKNYDFGKFELINFKPKDMDALNASMIYPSGYDPAKKYPMIVMIYENIADMALVFKAPNDRHSPTYNLYKFINEGYFVLLPDITYKVGYPGYSAVECVTMAVQKTLELNTAIDAEKIGLIGFSFGGYQASFIATQTNLFKAVVAGAPVTDMVSYYHDIAWDFESDQAWRLENQQFRMGKSFYDLKDNYYQNSALYHVEKLQTPLLLWTGEDDQNVNWYQSIYLYSAMKRLNKEGKLILFDDEKHSLMKIENQERLSYEVFNWFEKFLK